MAAAALALFIFAQDPEAWIRDLGSDEVEERERAARALVENFDASEAAVLKAAEAARDPEVAARLRAVLESGRRARERRDLQKLLPPDLVRSHPEFVDGLFSADPRVAREWIEAACLAEREGSPRSAVASHLSPAARRAALMAVLRSTPDRELKIRVVGLLEEFKGDPRVAAAIEPLLDPGDPTLYAAAARALGEIGHPASAGVLLAGFAALENDDLRRECEAAVARIGSSEEAAPHVRALLRSPRRDDRLAGARFAAALGVRDPDGLTALLDDPQDAALRHAALRTMAVPTEHVLALARFGPKPDRLMALQVLTEGRTLSAAPGVAELLRSDPDPSIRASAAAFLGAAGGDRWIGALVRAASDRSPEVRAEALAALGRLEAVRFTGEVTRHLGDGSPLVRYNALWALRRMGAHWTAPRVAELVGDPRWSADALETLVAWDAVDAAGRIAAAAESDNPSVRFYAVRALVLLGGRDHADAVRGRINDVSQQVRHLAIQGLAQLGVTDAGRTMMRLLEERNPQLQVRALEYIERTQGGDFAETAARFLEDRDPHLRAAAIRCAARLDAEAHAENFERLAADADENVRGEALRALSRLERGLPVLVKAMEDPEPRVRAEALKAAVAADRRGSIEAVRRCAAQAWKTGSWLELQALAECAPAELEPELARLLSHPERAVRLAAARSLARLDTRTADATLMRAFHLRDSALWPIAVESALRAGDREPVRRLLGHSDPAVRFGIVCSLQRLKAPKEWRSLEQVEIPFAEGVKALFPFELAARVGRRLPGGLVIHPEATPLLKLDRSQGFSEPRSAADVLADVCANSGYRVAFLLEGGGAVRLVTLEEAIRLSH